MMRQFRMVPHQLLERPDQTQMVLARLKIGNRQDKRRRQGKGGAHAALRCLARNGTKRGTHAVGQHHHSAVVEAVGIQNTALREFAGRKDASGGLDGALHRAAQLQASETS